MKTYSLEFHVQALKEWKKLDESIKAQFQKALAKRLQDPRVPSAKLRGELQNAYKIKLKDVGYLFNRYKQRQAMRFWYVVGRRFDPTLFVHPTPYNLIPRCYIFDYDLAV